MKSPLNIGEAAAASGVSAKMIRHYEAIGLITPTERTASNYRLFNENDVHILRFIRHARDLGFSIEQISTLLGLWKNKRRNSANVKKLALQHIAELDAKIEEMQTMRRTLQQLAQHCHGDERPECPILDELEGVQ